MINHRGSGSPEEQLRRNLEQLAKYRPLDDDFMREFFRNDLELAQFVLRILINKPDLRLIRQETQYDLKHLLGERAVCLDVFGTDDAGRLYDLEVQRSDSGADPHRARYHSSAMDVDHLKAKMQFHTLPDTYVIFITEHDVFGKGKAAYPIERMNLATGEPFQDGEHILYINGAYQNQQDHSDLAKLIHDFRCSDAAEMLLQPMAERTRFFKDTKEGGVRVSKLMEERIRLEIHDERIDFAAMLLSIGKLTPEEIAQAAKLPLAEVQQIAESLNPAGT